LFSIWFLLGSFMPGNDAEELAKMPVLLHHFQEHCSTEGKVDFIAFIKKHYDDAHAVGHEHQDLPFARHLQPCLIFVIPQVAALGGPVVSDLNPAANFPEISEILLSAHREPWQPPQLG
jgi:hypothetical protein